MTLTAPNTAVTWAIGSTQAITFTHNLGVGATVVIDLSRDGGASWATINPAFVTTSATTGTLQLGRAVSGDDHGPSPDRLGGEPRGERRERRRTSRSTGRSA